MQGAAGSGLSHFTEEVRRLDPDRFLTAQFAPPARREGLLALYAFNLEVARIAELVSEPMVGEIRLAWWGEAIAGIYEGKPRRHAVVEALAQAVQSADLPREIFDRLLEARGRDLDENPPANMAALNAYAEGTSSTLAELALRLLTEAPAGYLGQAELSGQDVFLQSQKPVRPELVEGRSMGLTSRLRQAQPERGQAQPERGQAQPERGETSISPDALEAARQAGLGWALCGILRAIPFHAAQGRVLLPAELLAAHSVDPHDLLHGRSSPGLGQIVKIIHGEAVAALGRARALRRAVPKAAAPALLPVTLASLYLKALAGAGFDPFAVNYDRGALLRRVAVIFNGLSGRF